jgi:hypothetical protein
MERAGAAADIECFGAQEESCGDRDTHALPHGLGQFDELGSRRLHIHDQRGETVVLAQGQGHAYRLGGCTMRTFMLRVRGYSTILRVGDCAGRATSGCHGGWRADRQRPPVTWKPVVRYGSSGSTQTVMKLAAAQSVRIARTQ